MFWLNCQLFSMSAINQSLRCRLKDSLVAALWKQLEVLQIPLQLIMLNHLL